MIAGQNLAWSGSELTNSNGLIQGGNDVAVTGLGTLRGTYGTVYAGHDLVLSGGSALLHGNWIQSGRDLSFSFTSSSTDGDVLFAGRNIGLSGTHATLTNNTVVYSQSNVATNFNTLTMLSSSLQSGGTTTVQGQNLVMNNGVMMSAGRLQSTLGTASTLTNGSTVYSGDALQWTGGRITLTDSVVQSRKDMGVNASVLDINNGVIVSSGALDVTAQTALLADGVLQGDRMTIQGTQFTGNHSGIYAKTSLGLTGTTTTLTQSSLQSDGNLNVTTTTLTLTGSTAKTDSTLTLSASGTSFLTNSVLSGTQGVSWAGTDGTATNTQASTQGAMTITFGHDIVINGGVWESGTAGLSAHNHLSVSNATVRSGSLDLSGTHGLDMANLVLLSNGTLHLVGGESENHIQNSILQGTDLVAVMGTSEGYGNGTLDTTQVYANSLSWIGSSLTANGSTVVTSRTQSYTLRDYTQTGGTVSAAGNLSIQAQRLTNTGDIISGANANLTVSAQLTNAGWIGAHHDITVQADATTGVGTISNTGTLASGTNMVLHANNTLNNQSGHLQSGAGMTLTADHGDLNNTNGAIASIGNMTVVSGADILNQTNGSLSSNGDINLTALRVVNSGTILGDAVKVQASRLLDNQAGSVDARNGLQVTVANGDITNENGHIQSNQTLTLTTNGTLNNQNGDIFSKTAFSIQANTLNNTRGAISALGNDMNDLASTLTTTQSINNQSGTIGTYGGLTVTATTIGNIDGQLGGNTLLNLSHVGAVNNTGGFLKSNGQLTAANVTNTNGQIEGGSVTLTDTGTFQNNGGTVYASNRNGALTLSAQNLANTNGSLYSKGTLDLTLSGDLLLGGSVASERDLSLRARTFENSATTLGSLGALTIATGAFINTTAIRGNHVAITSTTWNNSGTIEGIQSVRVDGTVLANTGVVNSGTLTQLNGESMANAGTIQSNGTLQMTLSQDLANSVNGKLLSGTLTDVEAGRVVNAGEISSVGDVSLKSNYTESSGVPVISDWVDSDSLNIYRNTSAMGITNSGLIAAGRDLTVHGQHGVSSGRLFAGRDMTMSLTGSFLNDNGTLHAERNMALNTTETLNNYLGTIETVGGNLTIQAQEIHNLRAPTRYIVTNTFDAINSTYVAGDYVLNRLDEASSDKGIIQSGAHMALTGDRILNDAGIISAVGDLTLSGGRFENLTHATQENHAIRSSWIVHHWDFWHLLQYGSYEWDTTEWGTSTYTLTLPDGHGMVYAGNLVLNNLGQFVNGGEANAITTYRYATGHSASELNGLSSNQEILLGRSLDTASQEAQDTYAVRWHDVHTIHHDAEYFTFFNKNWWETKPAWDETIDQWLTKTETRAVDPANSYMLHLDTNNTFLASPTTFQSAGTGPAVAHQGAGTTAVAAINPLILGQTGRALALSTDVISGDITGAGLRSAVSLVTTTGAAFAGVSVHDRITKDGPKTDNKQAKSAQQGQAVKSGRSDTFHGFIVDGGLGQSTYAHATGKQFQQGQVVKSGTSDTFHGFIVDGGLGQITYAHAMGKQFQQGQAVKSGTDEGRQNLTITGDLAPHTVTPIDNKTAQDGKSETSLVAITQSVLPGPGLGTVRHRGGLDDLFASSYNPDDLDVFNQTWVDRGELSLSGPRNPINGHNTYVPLHTTGMPVDLSQYVGSSYLLEKIANGQTYTVVGDSYTENQWIQDLVFEQTGKRFIVGGNDAEQSQMLMDNALAVKDQLGLQVGQALTAEQVAHLDHDILWLVSRVIDGQTVLAPTLYLSQATQADVANSHDVTIEAGTITGTVDEFVNLKGIDTHEGVDLDVAHDARNDGKITSEGLVRVKAGGSVANSGSILGNQVVVDGKVVKNTGTMNGYSLLSVHGDETVENVDGLLESKGIVIAKTDRGDVINRSTGKDREALIKGGTVLVDSGRDFVNSDAGVDAENAQIEANRNIELTRSEQAKSRVNGESKTKKADLDIANTLILKSVQDINMTAIRMDVKTNAMINAGRNLTLAAQPNGDTHRDTVVNVGGNLVMVSAGDMTLSGTDLTVGGSAALKSDGTMTFGTVDERSHSESHSRDTITGPSHTTQVVQTDRSVNTQTQRGVKLTVDGDLELDGNDIALTAVQFNVGNDLGVTAKRNLTIMDGKQRVTDRVESLRFGPGLGLHSEISETIHDNSIASQLNAGRRMVLKSGSDMTIIGSQFTSGGDMGLFSDKNMRIDSQLAPIKSGGAMTMYAGNDMTITNTALESKGDMGLFSDKNMRIDSQLAPIKSGGAMTVRAGNDLTITHTGLESNGDMGLFAGGKIALDSTKTTDVSDDGSGHHIRESVIQTTLKSGGNLVVSGTQGVGMTSVDFNAGKNIVINSDEGKISSTVVMLHNENSQSGGDRTHVDWTNTGVANRIQSGGNIIMTSKGDIDLEGAKMKAPGTVSLQSEEGDISLTGITNSSYTFDRHEWNTSSWWGLVNTHHVEQSEHYNEATDRTTIEAGAYQAQAGAGKDVIRQGTSVRAGTIYESGQNNHEKTTAMLSLNHDIHTENSDLNLGIVKIGDITKKEDEFRHRGIVNEVNENYASGQIVKDFKGSVNLEGSELASTSIVTIKGSDIHLGAVKDVDETTTRHSEMNFSGVSVFADSDKMRVGASTSYKGHTEITHSVDETV
ncbi:hypothetical protein EB093_07235, partial [bacterium]|nr:hypothetical protein [bacterium]